MLDGPYTCLAINEHLSNGEFSGNIIHTKLPNDINTNLAVLDETNTISNNTISEPPTTGIRTRLIICDSTRGHLVIYNYASASTVDADCSDLLSEGDSYRLTNVQDWANDIITGTAGANGIITVPMTGHTISTPIAWTAPESTFPVFGCFILEKI